MMLDPTSYTNQFIGCSFDKLIKERRRLIREINSLEKIVFIDDKTSEEWLIRPSPYVRYQMVLEYLSKLCAFMKDKFNSEVVWGER